MGRRGEFSEATKQTLQERAGHRCSFPGCDVTTIGPSSERPDATSKTGVACHIFAAADGRGARRRRPDLPASKLKALENGVWMCATHGKLIDSDECIYTPEQLTHWRKIAEAKARLRQQYGANVDTSKIVDPDLTLGEIAVHPTLDNLTIVGRAFFESCLSAVWGDDVASATREFAVEIARNAFEHGGASKVSIDIGPVSITIRDDGVTFDFRDLPHRSDRRGGGAAAEHVLTDLGSTIAVTYARERHQNAVVIARLRSTSELLKAIPCSVDFTASSLAPRLRNVIEFMLSNKSCRTVYAILRDDYISYSELHLIAIEREHCGIDDVELIVVVEDFSPALEQYVRNNLKNIRLLSLKA